MASDNANTAFCLFLFAHQLTIIFFYAPIVQTTRLLPVLVESTGFCMIKDDKSNYVV